VIEHLPEYLDRFTRSVQANGIILHRALDANEAVRIILEIAESPTNGGVGFVGPSPDFGL
jgi:L-lactate utilization protein LutB